MTRYSLFHISNRERTINSVITSVYYTHETQIRQEPASRLSRVIVCHTDRALSHWSLSNIAHMIACGYCLITVRHRVEISLSFLGNIPLLMASCFRSARRTGVRHLVLSWHHLTPVALISTLRAILPCLPVLSRPCYLRASGVSGYLLLHILGIATSRCPTLTARATAGTLLLNKSKYDWKHPKPAANRHLQARVYLVQIYLPQNYLLHPYIRMFDGKNA